MEGGGGSLEVSERVRRVSLERGEGASTLLIMLEPIPSELLPPLLRPLLLPHHADRAVEAAHTYIRAQRRAALARRQPARR